MVLWAHRVLDPNNMSIGSNVFAGLTSVTDQPTDRPRYSVGNNRQHLGLRTYTAMRSKRISGKAYDVNKQTTYITPKSTNESRTQYSPEPTRGAYALNH